MRGPVCVKWARVIVVVSLCSTLLSTALLCATSATAADHFLTIGGGYSPAGNQASLEKNVLFFQHLLTDLSLSGAQHDILFSDGDSPGRDLQYIDPTVGVPRSNLLAARVFDKEDDLDARFRTHAVPGVRGVSSPENLDRWIEDVGRSLHDGDRLVIYLTGHGGKGSDAQNPHFFMWNRQQVPVKDFVARLDKIDPAVHVVLVMVQCYSGGFANCIFNEGDPQKGISPANRCGFFATVHNRPAAGCTPDIDEENYQEYSSSFWAAIGGHSRTGQTVSPRDCDADGRISFAEAHGFTLLNSNTIDIPVKTSDAFLRAFSKTKADDIPDLLTADAPYATLAELASPIERAVLDGLSRELSLASSERSKEARNLAAAIEKKRGEINQHKKKLQGEYNRARQAIAEMLKVRWPELANPWHPAVAEELRREGPDIVAAVESHTRYSDFARLHDEIAADGSKSLDLERQWVKCQRILRLTENIALAANLARVATQEMQDRYHALLASEADTLCGARD